MQNSLNTACSMNSVFCMHTSINPTGSVHRQHTSVYILYLIYAGINPCIKFPRVLVQLDLNKLPHPILKFHSREVCLFLSLDGFLFLYGSLAGGVSFSLVHSWRRTFPSSGSLARKWGSLPAFTLIWIFTFSGSLARGFSLPLVPSQGRVFPSSGSLAVEGFPFLWFPRRGGFSLPLVSSQGRVLPFSGSLAREGFSFLWFHCRGGFSVPLVFSQGRVFCRMYSLV